MTDPIASHTAAEGFEPVERPAGQPQYTREDLRKATLHFVLEERADPEFSAVDATLRFVRKADVEAVATGQPSRVPEGSA